MIKQNRILLAAIAVTLGFPLAAQASPFAVGDIVVERIGTGGAALSSAAQAVFLNEYSPTGTLVQSIAMPTATIGAQQALTESGNAATDGMLTLSANGQYLVVPGYDAATTTAGVVTGTEDRTVGRVDGNGNVDTTTHALFFSANNFRTVASPDGTTFYVGGTGSGSDKGIYELPYGATSISAATNINTSASDGLGIFGNTLYSSTTAGSNSYVVQVGTAGTLPTSSGTALTQLSGLPIGTSNPSPHQFVEFTEAGHQVIYVADDTGNALTKYELVGSTWTSEGKVGAGVDDVTGLTGSYNSVTGAVTLYATELEGSGSAGGVAKFVSVIDTAGPGGSLTGTTVNLLATAPGNETFAGVAFAPVVVPTPEPASVVMAVLGFFALVGYGWRRRSAA